MLSLSSIVASDSSFAPVATLSSSLSRMRSENRQSMKGHSHAASCCRVHWYPLLLAAVVGSGIMAERLAAGMSHWRCLLTPSLQEPRSLRSSSHSGSISGAHFNPPSRWRTRTSAEFLGDMSLPTCLRRSQGLLRRGRRSPNVWPYIILEFDTRQEWSSSGVQRVYRNFGLMAVIWGCARSQPNAVPYAVGTYITAAYWFTASTSFANRPSRWPAL